MLEDDLELVPLPDDGELHLPRPEACDARDKTAHTPGEWIIPFHEFSFVDVNLRCGLNPRTHPGSMQD